jgi:hypothetical protein
MLDVEPPLEHPNANIASEINQRFASICERCHGMGRARLRDQDSAKASQHSV